MSCFNILFSKRSTKISKIISDKTKSIGDIKYFNNIILQNAMKRFIKQNLFDMSEQYINNINNELFRNIIFLVHLS